MNCSVVEKSSKSRVVLSGPTHRMTSTPAGSSAMSLGKREWMAIRRALRMASAGRLGWAGVKVGGAQSSTTIREAPASMARPIGTLSTTPPSMNRSPSISTGG